MSAVVTLDAADLVKSLNNVTNNLEKQLLICSSKVSRKTKSAIAKAISKKVAVKQKVVKKHLRRVKVGKTSYSVTLEESKRIPLRDFGARQTWAGVSYKIDKAGSRKTLAGAFQGAKPGVRHVRWQNKVFKRRTKDRKPIFHVRGPSPSGVFILNNQQKLVLIDTNAELRKQLAERIRFLKLKKSGAI